MPRRINIPDPKELLRNIAGMYQSATRVIMEYIDNSLDDAEYFYENEGRYPYPIEITAEIDPKNRRVTVYDNCRGMTRDKLARIVEYVGCSDKKAQPWTNGQFGFGVHAFRACCRELEIITKTRDGNPWHMVIPRDTNEVADEEEMPSRSFPHPSGTMVILKGFERDWWKELDPEALVKEIELHFNHLLRRKGLNLQVVEGNRTYICKPYDISIFDGEEFTREISRIRDRRGVTITLPRPVQVHLKVCRTPVAGKQPLFLNKGRRIEEVRRTKSYLNVSPHKGKIWAHPHLVGYIEMNGNLEPTLDRADFKRSSKRKPIYEEIAGMEEEIYAALAKISRSSSAESLTRLGSLLTRLLEEMAREDRMLLREAFGKGDEVSLAASDDGDTELVEPGEGDGEAGKTAGEPGGEATEVVEEPGELSGRRRRRSGFAVRFDDTSLDALIQDDGSIPRSSLIEDTINIYVNHPDFDERVARDRRGALKLTERLASYLASIIAAHYKDAFYNRYKLQPEVRRLVGSRTAMFDDFIDFTCRLEKRLCGYAGADLEQVSEV